MATRLHVHLFDAFDQLLDIREAVEQGVFRVDVKVGEGHEGLGNK